MGETGCFTTQTLLKVIALKGAKEVGAVTSTERGSLVTMIGTINAIKTQFLLTLLFQDPAL